MKPKKKSPATSLANRKPRHKSSFVIGCDGEAAILITEDLIGQDLGAFSSIDDGNMLRILSQGSSAFMNGEKP